jgi:hypothetical protein
VNVQRSQAVCDLAAARENLGDAQPGGGVVPALIERALVWGDRWLAEHPDDELKPVTVETVRRLDWWYYAPLGQWSSPWTYHVNIVRPRVVYWPGYGRGEWWVDEGPSSTQMVRVANVETMGQLRNLLKVMGLL